VPHEESHHRDLEAGRGRDQGSGAARTCPGGIVRATPEHRDDLAVGEHRECRREP
jgi:hypothetical protein